MRIALIILFFLSLLFLTSCSNSNPDEINSLEKQVKSPLYSVRGEACLVFEDDIFAFENKHSFTECEIRQNPETFNGKIVRVKADYGFMIHGSYLADKDGCPELSKSIDSSISVGFRTDKDFSYIKDMKFIPVSIIAVGKFTVSPPSHESDTIYDRTPYHFEVICLEKAEKQKEL